MVKQTLHSDVARASARTVATHGLLNKNSHLSKYLDRHSQWEPPWGVYAGLPASLLSATLQAPQQRESAVVLSARSGATWRNGAGGAQPSAVLATACCTAPASPTNALTCLDHPTAAAVLTAGGARCPRTRTRPRTKRVASPFQLRTPAQGGVGAQLGAIRGKCCVRTILLLCFRL